MINYLVSLITPVAKASQDKTTPANLVNIAVSFDMSDEAIVRQVQESVVRLTVGDLQMSIPSTPGRSDTKLQCFTSPLTAHSMP
jgi:hypothetical protein